MNRQVRDPRYLLLVLLASCVETRQGLEADPGKGMQPGTSPPAATGGSGGGAAALGGAGGTSALQGGASGGGGLGGMTSDPGTSDAGATGGTSGIGDGGAPDPSTGDVPRAVQPPQVLAACARRKEHRSLTGAALRTAITRRWLLCSDRGLFHQPQAGFEIRADGRLSLLGWGANGLETLRGAANEGTFTVVNEGQTNFDSDLGGTVITFPLFSSDPRGLWIDNEGVFQYDYVAAEDVDLSSIPPPPPPPPPVLRAPECQGAPGSAVTPGTISAMRQALSRRWVLCSPQGLFGGDQLEGGIEIVADDRYYRLGRNAQGGLERNGPRSELSYIDTSSFNGRPSIQVNFAGGSIISHPVLTVAPAWLIINNNGVQEYRYVAVP
jgi:hypothetical protein